MTGVDSVTPCPVLLIASLRVSDSVGENGETASEKVKCRVAAKNRETGQTNQSDVSKFLLTKKS